MFGNFGGVGSCQLAVVVEEKNREWRRDLVMMLLSQRRTRVICGLFRQRLKRRSRSDPGRVYILY